MRFMNLLSGAGACATALSTLVIASSADAVRMTASVTIPNPQITVVSGGIGTPYPAPTITFAATYDTSEVNIFPHNYGHGVMAAIAISVPGLPDAVIADHNPAVDVLKSGNVSDVLFFWSGPGLSEQEGAGAFPAPANVSLFEPSTFVTGTNTFDSITSAQRVSFMLPDGRSVLVTAYPPVDGTVSIALASQPPGGALPVPTLGRWALLAVVALIGAVYAAHRHRAHRRRSGWWS
jgi:hypothetical protein